MGDTWELINHPMSDETGLELAAQMKRQNDILAGIAAGTAGAEFVDATFRGLLDGKNTTEIFWSWWPLSAMRCRTCWAGSSAAPSRARPWSSGPPPAWPWPG